MGLESVLTGLGLLPLLLERLPTLPLLPLEDLGAYCWCQVPGPAWQLSPPSPGAAAFQDWRI